MAVTSALYFPSRIRVYSAEDRGVLTHREVTELLSGHLA